MAVGLVCIALSAGCKHAQGAMAEPSIKTFRLPGELPLQMAWIPAGTFLMGRAPDERDARADETPQHQVTLSHGFWLGTGEVTQAQWQAVMGTRPWEGKACVTESPNCPAVYISWEDARAFVETLNQRTKKAFRLPTESEWEYACRAGAATRFYWGDDLQYAGIGHFAWWRGNALVTGEKQAHPGGGKRPNAWNLYDMSGNVAEWCQDNYGPYSGQCAVDPPGPATGEQRVNRGGNWMSFGGQCRSACRGHDKPSAAFEDLGFRIALSDEAMEAKQLPSNPFLWKDVFVSGTEGVDTYRIPSMIVVPDGSLLVFCEARKQSIADASPTDMVLRRSLDGGRTWLPMQTLVHGTGDEALMNPCPVIDRSSKTLLLFCINANKTGEGHNRHLLLRSTDSGQTWSEPVEVGALIRGYDDSFVSGPGVGIQMRKGRLVIPGYAGLPDDETKSGNHSRVLFSDDHGATWTLGAPVPEFTDESQVIERNDGSLMLNMRGDMGRDCRGVAISRNGGETWDKMFWDPALNECPCQASLIRYGAAKSGTGDALLFANPDNIGEQFGAVERSRMTVRLSWDDGRTWPVKRLVHPGPSSYSSLVRLPDGDIGLVFEGGEKHRREWIRFVRFPLSWLMDASVCPVK